MGSIAFFVCGVYFFRRIPSFSFFVSTKKDDKNSGGNAGENISTASVVGEVVDTLANVAGAAALIL